MLLFPSDARRARFLYADAYRVRNELVRDELRICAIEFLEFYLPMQQNGLVINIIDDLRASDGTKIDGATKFTAPPQVEIDEVVYDLARKKYDGASRFSIFHEGCHVLHHLDDARAKKITQLNRGVPFSGTSFKENDQLEAEANLWACGLLIPHTAINSETTAYDLVARYQTSRASAEAAIKRARVIFPEKWRLK